MELKFHCIAAVDESLGIGYQGKLPWRLKADMLWFKETTSAIAQPKKAANNNNKPLNSIIMGRKTWLSLHPNYRPLKQRLNIILTTRPEEKDFLGRSSNKANECIQIANSPNKALDLAKEYAMYPQCKDKNMAEPSKVFVIGGAQIFRLFLSEPYIKNLRSLYITHIRKHFNCDTFFPDIFSYFKEKKVHLEGHENGLAYSIIEYIK